MTSDVVYPYNDDIGYAWVDPSGFLSVYKKPCFICQRLTNRLDINFDAFFCNSYACNLTIEFDLKEIENVNDPYVRSLL